VVDDDAQIRLSINELDRHRKLALEKEQIVAQVQIRQKRETAMEIIPQEVFVRLALEDVPYRLRLWMRGETGKGFSDIFIDERHPTDDAGDPLGLIRQRKQPVGFLQNLPGLHDHRGIHPGGRGGVFEFREKMILRERRAGRNPIVLLG
jgi:hypothetical protein